MNGPIFVVGTPRSGTTLTASILGNHHQIFMPGENHFYEVVATTDPLLPLNKKARTGAVERLLRIYGDYNQPEDQADTDSLFGTKTGVVELEGAAETYASLFSYFMQRRLSETTKARWGNQAPKDIFNVRKIHAAHPSAHFIVCVRDARDFLLSYKQRWRVSEHGARLKALYHPVLTALLWRSTMKQIDVVQSLVPEDRVTLVKYEQLVRCPEDTIRMLCQRLDIEFDSEMLEGLGHNSSIPGQADGVFVTSIGRWRSELNSAEVSVAQSVTGKLLEKYGYEVADVKGQLSQLAYIWLSFPVRIFTALWANRNNRGPLIPYLLRRLRNQ